MKRIRRPGPRISYLFQPKDPRLLTATRLVAKIEGVPVLQVFEKALEHALDAYGPTLRRHALALRLEAEQAPREEAAARERYRAAHEWLALQDQRLPELQKLVNDFIAQQTHPTEEIPA